MRVDFIQIITDAWNNYDSSREIKTIEDISAKVSTNHVYRLRFEDDDSIIGKLSYFGEYEDFIKDHSIINALSTNLTAPFENFLAKSLTKRGELFAYRHQDSLLDAWVVFYNPIQIDQRPEKRQTEPHIEKLGRELARFHKACAKVRNTLPMDFKQTEDDIQDLMDALETEEGQFIYRGHEDIIKRQCHEYLENCEKIGVSDLTSIPVFVDWNIGNFSIREDYSFYSRWDYDWFRMSTRTMDFYFFSRVCSDAGDKTVFSYLIDPMMEERFLIFLKAYHEVFPLTAQEVIAMKEAYRFFILNYVIKEGTYFFHDIYAMRLMQEAYSTYFPEINKFNEEHFLRALNL